METFVQALTLSLTSLVMAFSVLILIMLLMYASAALLGRAEPEAPASSQQVRQTTVVGSPSPTTAEATDQTELVAIMAALQAAEVDIPAGGRVRIEKVSRRG